MVPMTPTLSFIAIILICHIVCAYCFVGCDEFMDGLVCYHNSQHPLLLTILKHLAPKLHLKAIPDVAQDACVFSSSQHLSVLHEQTGNKLSVFVIKPSSCYSFGNMIGNFYEAISFGAKHGVVVFRANGDCDGLVHNASIISGLPHIFIPNTPVKTLLSKDTCKSGIPSRSPWDSDQSLYWSTIGPVSKINHKMIHEFRSQPSFSKTSVSDSENTLAIHYRCSDNVVSGIYGLFPYTTYKNILSEISDKYINKEYHRMDSNGKHVTTFSKITIISDAKETGAYGMLCWHLVGLLRDKIPSLPGFQDMRIDIVYATPSTSMVLLHTAKVVICSVSTYCLFATLGSSDNNAVYFHKSKQLVNPPSSFWDSTRSEMQSNISYAHKYIPFESPTFTKDEQSDWKSFAKRLFTS